VVGVLVTGADRIENANKTEHHGAIVIDVLDLLDLSKVRKNAATVGAAVLPEEAQSPKATT
jgi:hypothetical protein